MPKHPAPSCRGRMPGGSKASHQTLKPGSAIRATLALLETAHRLPTSPAGMDICILLIPCCLLGITEDLQVEMTEAGG